MSVKISFIINSDFYLKNKIFDENNEAVNRDDCQRHIIELRNNCLELNWQMDTYDILPIESSDIAFFVNTPDENDPNLIKALTHKIKLYLLINELEYIHTNNMNLEGHKFFDKIFTYQDRLVDNKRYFKVNYSFDFNRLNLNSKLIPFREKKFAVLIAGNKVLNHKNELYSERIKTIKWFEKNQLDKFDLFGRGWNENFGILRSLFSYNYKSYRGEIKSKIDTLSFYKFNICYENANNVKGWITEKLFDSFFAGCVPIYWGCESIYKYVDEGCFIDRSSFLSEKHMFEYIENIDEIRYQAYISAIANFIEKKKNDINFEFGIPYFKKTILDQISKDIYES